MKDIVKNILISVVHPETGTDLVAGGFVDIDSDVTTAQEPDGTSLSVTLHFKKSRDPFAASLTRRVREQSEAALPGVHVNVRAVEGEAPKKNPHADPAAKKSFTHGIKHTVAIASGKGGVGKSTVTANLAAALRNAGYSVAILDADIYGPSQPKMFGCEDYVPMAEERDGTEVIIPAEAEGIKLMSIGFFVGAEDALLWRGPMAVNALRQLVHQTLWGDVDFLLIDLPPGTGDIHLSIITELKIDGAVIVSTPQQVAVADVVRGVEMFRNPNVQIPVLGIVENMAWFTPRELPENRYYIFGRGGARRYAEEQGTELLGEIPLIQSIAESADNGTIAKGIDAEAVAYYRQIAARVVEKVAEGVDKR